MKPEAPSDRLPPGEVYLTVKQAAEYLHLNEKTLYALISEGAVPATKATGKWLFPRRLLDEWLLESAHGGALTDRLLIGGSDDPLLAASVTLFAADLGAEGLAAISPQGTRLGLELLARRRINVCAMHWGPAEASVVMHPQLVQSFPASRDWTLVRMALREQGVILSRAFAGAGDLAALAGQAARWAMRQEGAGSQHFLRLALHDQAIPFDALTARTVAYSERHAAALIAQGHADCAPGARSAAAEFGLGFLALGWEAFDLVLPRQVYFRGLFQRLLETLRSDRVRTIAAGLRGYDLAPLGQLVPLPER